MYNVCNLFVLGFDLRIMKYHVKCNEDDSEDEEAAMDEAVALVPTTWDGEGGNE